MIREITREDYTGWRCGEDSGYDGDIYLAFSHGYLHLQVMKSWRLVNLNFYLMGRIGKKVISAMREDLVLLRDFLKEKGIEGIMVIRHGCTRGQDKLMRRLGFPPSIPFEFEGNSFLVSIMEV